jgi:Mg2+ and Co2+ transporter CorA
VEITVVTPEGAERHRPDDLAALRAAAGPDALLWVDVPAWDEEAESLLVPVFGIHPRAAGDCARRNPVPKVHVYADHVFVVLHAPERGARGHVHYLELDQFVGPGWLVTVHGPVNPAVAPEAALAETATVARRLFAGRLRPRSAHELSFAAVTAIGGRMRDYLVALTQEAWNLERQVTGGHLGNAEQFLEELFSVRHGLLTLETMAAQTREVYGRMTTLVAFGEAGHRLVADLEDQFRRLAQMADAQREYLHGVIEFYQTRTNTKMTIAAERLAVIAALTLPVTAVSSVMGMNVIVNDSTHVEWLAALLALMVGMSVAMLIWARRQGWW